MKVLIAGGGGQLGRALERTAPSDFDVHALTRVEFDLENSSQIAAAIASLKPDVLVNAAAYTAVDRAERDSERALAINGTAVHALASHCAEAGVRLIHVSTDYVFGGNSQRAYETDDATHPVNAYGASKLAGEQAIAANGKVNAVIVRTSWVYSPWGANFLLTMLRLMRDRGSVSVVADQIGSPTSALTLARFLWRVAAQSSTNKILHYTDAGVASWFDFAVAINEEAHDAGVLPKLASVSPISTAEYPTPAKRPAFSLLSTRSSLAAIDFAQPHWRVALRETIRELHP
jgi:dTDP-4-dehydrorhamnose reductase